MDDGKLFPLARDQGWWFAVFIKRNEKKSLFTHHMFGIWNALPPDAVKVGSTISFVFGLIYSEENVTGLWSSNLGEGSVSSSCPELALT